MRGKQKVKNMALGVGWLLAVAGATILVAWLKGK